MTHKHSTLILVDGSSYLYRAFHAMPSLMNSKGIPTGATYGVINMLRKLITDYDPEYMAVVFDAKGKTFRNDLYPQYKANRPPMPSELRLQIEDIHHIIKAMGLPIIIIDGVEADDVIGTIAKETAKKGIPTLISTGDKDLAQLVDEHITLVNTMSDSFLTPTSVQEKFGVPPRLIVDYLALIGDTSDNIPGVPMVGPKTAAKWLLEYDSVTELLAHADKIKGKVGSNLRESLAQIPLAQQLATIKTDVPNLLTHAELKRSAPDNEQLIHLFKQLEFKTWLANVLGDKTDPPKLENKMAKIQYETILTEAELTHWLKLISEADYFAFDTETTSLNYINAKLVGMSFAVKPGLAAYLPLMHTDTSKTQLPFDFVMQKIKPILENSRYKKIGHNIKYDVEILKNHDIHLAGIQSDTMLEAYVVDSSGKTYGMDALAQKHLNIKTITYEDVAGKGTKQICFSEVGIDTAAHYAAEDADVTLQLHEYFKKHLQNESKLENILHQIEIPLIDVLARMECGGVMIDANKLRLQTTELEKKLMLSQDAAFVLAGKPFNIGSPKQLQDILFNVLNIPVLQKTPTGQPSTADAVLQELAHDYELPKLIIEHRSLSKLISTYTKRLPEQINPKTNRVHTSYNQTGAATGRLSSSDPNLQNIPIRMAEGKKIRQAFIAPSGYRIVSADYSQIELRLMAHMSADPALLYAFQNNLDIHQATAAEVMGIALEDVTQAQRRSAKAINFGLIYGMSAFGLSKQIGVSRNEAQEYIDMYFARYPLVKKYMEDTREKAHNQGYVETLWGRRLYLPEINSRQIMRQKAAERAAINAPLQGTAADIIKAAMIKIDDWTRSQQNQVKMVMQVHDELVFEVADAAVPNSIEKIRELMVNAIQLAVPLEVSIGEGNNWDASSNH